MLSVRAPAPLLVLAGLLALAPAPSRAQHAPPPGALRTVAPAAPAANNAATGWLVLGGAAGAGAGIVGGALAGMAYSCMDECGYRAPLWGAIVGEIVLLPLGVHVANGRKGSYGLELLASAGLGAGGVLLGQQWTDAAPYLAYLVPLAQIAAVAYVEQRTSGASGVRAGYSYSFAF